MKYLEVEMLGGNPSDLIRPRLEIECRRYKKPGLKWSVFINTGWPGERPAKWKLHADKSTVRKFLSEFLERNPQAVMSHRKSQRGLHEH